MVEALKGKELFHLHFWDGAVGKAECLPLGVIIQRPGHAPCCSCDFG